MDEKKDMDLEAKETEAPKAELSDETLDDVAGGRKIDTSKLKPEDVWIPIN